MITRRKFSMLASSVGAVGLGAGGMMASSCADGATAVNSTDTFRMPDESEPHTRTWMGFGASEAIWGKTLLPVVRRNLALIANTIAKYEPVSMLVRANEMDIAKGLLGNCVTLVEANLDDFWLRDTGPVFVLNQQNVKAGIKFNFNGWGSKQNHAADANVANRVISAANVDLVKTNLVLEGGGIIRFAHMTGCCQCGNLQLAAFGIGAVFQNSQMLSRQGVVG